MFWFWIGLAIFGGCLLGMFVRGLCITASNADREMERSYQGVRGHLHQYPDPDDIAY